MPDVKKDARFTFFLCTAVVLFSIPLIGCSGGEDDSHAFDAYLIPQSSDAGEQVFDETVLHHPWNITAPIYQVIPISVTNGLMKRTMHR